MHLPRSIILLCLLFIGSNAQRQPEQMICKPFGSCGPCPDEALNQPFCKPFGNRRLMHCIPRLSNSSASEDPTSHIPTQGETPAWQACGRIPSKERSDFYEFVLCNVMFGLLALGTFFVRSKRLQIMQARQLAARIGLVRGSGGVLVRG